MGFIFKEESVLECFWVRLTVRKKKAVYCEFCWKLEIQVFMKLKDF